MTDVLVNPALDADDDNDDDSPAPKAPKLPMTEDEKIASLQEFYKNTIAPETRQALAETKFTGVFGWIRAGDINADKSYQRRVNMNKGKRLLRNFDPLAFEPVTVSKRVDANGNVTYTTPEGQHRSLIAKIINPDMMIPCFIHEDLTVEDEAHQTGTIHRGRTSFSALDLFRTDLAAGAADAVAVDRIVKEAGYEIGGPDGILAVKALRKIHEQTGDDGLAATLRVIDKAWVVAYPDDAWGYTTLAGVGEFIRKNTDKDSAEVLYDETHLVFTLAQPQSSPENLVGQVMNSKTHYTSKPKGVADLISKYYNRSRPTGAGIKKAS